MITVTLTEKEILATPNVYDLGKLVQDRFWTQKKKADEMARILQETQAEIPFPEYEGEPKPSDVQSLSNEEQLPFPAYDRCVTCGAESPYTQDLHIDFRIGYVEGGGQGCFQPAKCSK